ncbi:MAG: cation diffusion facilitator family transporter [Nanobdellota archaeon]
MKAKVNFIANIFLFIIKLFAGVITNSIAIISDALNSFSDIISSFAIKFSVSMSKKEADSDHPFGHHRAEPIAALMVAIFTAMLGFEVMRSSVMRFFSGSSVEYSFLAVIVMVIAIAIKLFLYFFMKSRSTALSAASVDARNDVLASSLALIALIMSTLGYTFVDVITGLGIGFFIIRSGYMLGRENIGYLMGASPSADFYNQVEKDIKRVEGVRGVHDLRIHYVGTVYHAEVHIEVDKDILTKKSHDIGKKVQEAMETREGIDRAFVHIDPK